VRGWAVRREFEAHHDRFSSWWIAGQNSHLTALNSWIIHPGQLNGFHDNGPRIYDST
jgi:hypothetical protein